MFEYCQNTYQFYYELFLEQFNVILDEFLRIKNKYINRKVDTDRERLICMQKEIVAATKEYTKTIQMTTCVVCCESGKQTHCQTCFTITCQRCTKRMRFCRYCRAEPKMKSWAAIDDTPSHTWIPNESFSDDSE